MSWIRYIFRRGRLSDIWEGIEEHIRRKMIQKLDTRMSGGDPII